MGKITQACASADAPLSCRHLSLRQQAANGSNRKVLLLESGKEVGHLFLSSIAVTNTWSSLVYRRIVAKRAYLVLRDKQRFASADQQSLSDFNCTIGTYFGELCNVPPLWRVLFWVLTRPGSEHIREYVLMFSGSRTWEC